jgi:hypothetical protein
MSLNISPNPRRSDRRPAAIPVRLVLEAEKFKADNSAITTDISTDGVGVRTTLSLAPGEWVGFIKKGQFPHAVPSRVVWAREDTYSGWVFAGLEFLPARI